MNRRPTVMILGTGRALPTKVVSNADLEKIVDTNAEWIRTRTGIEQRHIAEPGSALSDLAAEAAQKALDDAGVLADQIDLIIFGTVTADMKFPSAACLVQAKIGAKNAAAFDLSAACSGFLYSLTVAEGLMATAGYKRVLVIGGEILSSMIDWKDRNTCVLFGDGAGAVVLGPAENERGLLASYLKSDGDFARLLYNEGGSLNPPSAENLATNKYYIHMEGQEVFRNAVVSMTDALKRVLAKAGMQIGDLDLLIPHQANLRIIEAVGKRFKIPAKKVYVNVDRYGNTSAASIPIALDEAWRSGRIQEGSVVAMVTFGAGFTWAAGIVRL